MLQLTKFSSCNGHFPLLFSGIVQVNRYNSSRIMDTVDSRQDMTNQSFYYFLHNKIKHSEVIGGSDSGRAQGVSSYVLALGYSEQISTGIHSVLQLSGLAKDFEANLVEPTVVTSHLFGIEGVYPTYYNQPEENRSVKLFYLFNQSTINQVIYYMRHLIKMVTFAEFLTNAPRNISIFHFNSPNLAKTNRLFTFPKKEVEDLMSIFKKNPKRQMFNCLTGMEYTGMIQLSKMVERKLNKATGGVSNDKFKVAEGLCLNHDHIYRSYELLREIPTPRTIIFSNWGGCGLKQCTFGSKDLDREREAMAAVPHIRHSVLTQKALDFHRTSLLHHNHVHTMAKGYLKHLGFTPRDFISVHVRLERIVRYTLEFKIDGTYKKCRDSALRVVNRIIHGSDTDSYKKKYRTSHEVLAMSDNPGSEFGTDTCSGRMCSLKEVNRLFNYYKKSFNFYSFDPRVWGVVRNGGLVSLVEMHMLSMSKKLVLVGYGGFQAVLKDLFLSLGHDASDVYHVCNFLKQKKKLSRKIQV